LWKGNLVSVLHKFPYGGINYYAYEQSKILLIDSWKSPTDPGIGVRFVCGFIGGSSASALTYPLDILRTRLAASAEKRRGIDVMREVVAQRLLFKGLGTTLLCQGGNIAINFAVYETLQVKAIEFERNLMKKYFNVESKDPSKQRGSWLSSLLCGAVSGCTGSFIIFPLDLIRRRQQVGGHAAGSAWDVARKVVKSDGMKGLYRGIIPELTKVVPAVFINFYVYELVRQDLLGYAVAPR
jgi:hypothetical protein